MKFKKYITIKTIPKKTGYELKEVDAIPLEVIEDLIQQGHDIIHSDVDLNFRNNVRKKVDFLNALLKTWKVKKDA